MDTKITDKLFLKKHKVVNFYNYEYYTQTVWFYQIDDDTLNFLFEQGWRRAGFLFYRISHEPLLVEGEELGDVLPLRVAVTNFEMTKSQRKIMRKNQHFRMEVNNILPTQDHQILFELHKQRFKDLVPTSIENFTGISHDLLPTRGKILDVYDGDQLIASSFLDVTPQSVSSIYAMFHPDYGANSLGIYTMLLEIQYTKERGGTFWYPGFAHHQSSFYDYKKRFNNLEYFNWKKWLHYPRLKEPTEK
jgi:arginine-tRNA-protein transferase